MNRFVFYILFFLSSATISGRSDSDSILYTDHIFDQRIKTVKLNKEAWNLSYPIIKLKSNDKLVLNFDLLDNQPETYNYTIIHCDKDWKKSDILPNDYANGNAENPVESYTNSFNTTVSYIHYKIAFPNDRISINLSGNYILCVYPPDKPEEPALTCRFVVTEDATKIDVITHRPQMTKENNNLQQVDFIVNYTGLSINDPYRNVFAFILQNGRWDNAKRDLKPDFYGNYELKYNSLSNKNIFRGGNEYRYFDIKSIKHQSEYVKKIDYVTPNYNVYLYPSENREFKSYFYWKDFNGKYYIAFQEGKNPDTDADYVYVYFTLPSDQIITGGDIYVSGELNNWTCDKNNLMKYNPERKEYECTMLLKQGWYNYEFAYMKKGATDATATIFEGSHFETENDYIVLIYYRNPNDRYDRVIGAAIANTLNRMTN
jgi:hypothetical protein